MPNNDLVKNAETCSRCEQEILQYHGIRQVITVQHFNNQLTHTTLKNVELLKHFKISKTAPTYFGLQGNHHQGATISI